VPLDPDWLRLQEAGAGFPSAKRVTGPRGAARAERVGPAASGRKRQDLPPVSASLDRGTPITHLVAARAGGLLPRVETDILPDVSLPRSRLRSSGGIPIALPHAAPERLGRHLTGFLGP